MAVITKPSINIAVWLFETMSQLPSVVALGPPQRVWEDEAPGSIPFPVVVFQRVGPGITISPIGGRAVAYKFLYQWRVVDEGADTATIEDIAQEIWMATDYEVVSLPDGSSLTCTEASPEVIPVGPEGGDSTTEELGGELEILLSVPVIG